MIKSMTGFGKAAAESDKFELQIEIKSVNNRYLDLNFRIPSFLQQYEINLRNEIKSKIGRGSISIFFSLVKKNSTEFIIDDDPKLNFSNEKIIATFSKLIETSKIVGLDTNSITWDLILKHFDILAEKKKDTDNDDDKEFYKFLSTTIHDALDKLIDFRTKEGKSLFDDIGLKIQTLKETVLEVQKLSKNAAKTQFDKLKDRLDKYTDLSKFDKSRLEQELVIISDKVDIDEEIIRLFSHIDLFTNTIDDKIAKPVGQKLNFITQEMHREVNTISSKTSLTDISHLAVNMKEIIEKIREQVQNIE